MKQCFKTIKLVVTILVSAKANETRLNNLILLIAISYTISSFQVQKVKNKRVQEYISRTNEKGRKERIKEKGRAKAKGKKPKSKTKGRYMPKATYQRTDKKTLRYQDAKKRKGRKKGIQHVPTGKKFSQK